MRAVRGVLLQTAATPSDVAAAVAKPPRVRGGPNGRLSLTEARRNFHVMGVRDERCTAFVGDPRPDEHPAV
ncbi:CPCC family cysteine-rich protein [Streptomyces sp. NPDC005065]|uniref:CPCC family cysteine-rich protein n=1 Tax=unclassified Streptomyces TaxID=2593676 RepID=UPI0033A1861D